MSLVPGHTANEEPGRGFVARQSSRHAVSHPSGRTMWLSYPQEERAIISMGGGKGESVEGRTIEVGPSLPQHPVAWPSPAPSPRRPSVCSSGEKPLSPHSVGGSCSAGLSSCPGALGPASSHRPLAQPTPRRGQEPAPGEAQAEPSRVWPAREGSSF